MSFFDDASLVFLPSGEAGKDGKAYSMKPTNGDGDFTFSRGSNLTATRVDSNGLIEKGRENLLLQSNQFDTTWAKTNVILTSGQSGYDGSTDAWKIEANTSSTTTITQAASISGVMTASIYAKEGTTNWFRFSINDSGVNTRVWFDLSGSGAVGSTAGNIIDSKIESVGNGYFRCSITFNATAANLLLFLADANSSISPSAGDYIYIQDAQLEQGLVATEYIESGATTGLAGILEDSPRFDYSGGASCPSLLLEPSRTQLLPYSEYYNGWTQSGTTLTTNTTETLSPEGLYNASKLVGNGTSGVINSGIAKTGSVVVSVYLKSVSGSVNVTFKDPYGGLANEVKSVTTEWQRFDFIGDNGFSFAGFWIDDIPASGIYMWGAQLEEGSYPTSYIPNHSGGSVTRELDHCFTSSNSVLEEINATYFLEVTPIQIASNNLLEVRANGSINNRILLQTSSLGVLRVLVRAQGSSVLDQNISGAVSANTKVKIALKYTDRTNISVFVDGVKEIDTDLVIDFSPELNGLDLEGSATANNDSLKQHQFIFFPTALSDANCITLTS